MSPVPERLRWAVDVLDPHPADQILEIGGGPGVSAGLVCERLTTGQLLAVDRSAVAIERTVRRNATHVASGRLAVQRCELHALDVSNRNFDKVFAINVNLFWVADPERELAVLTAALRPAGVLHIFYGPAGPTPPDRIIDAVSTALRTHGFRSVRVIRAPSGTGISARTSRAGREGSSGPADRPDERPVAPSQRGRGQPSSSPSSPTGRTVSGR